MNRPVFIHTIPKTPQDSVVIVPSQRIVPTNPIRLLRRISRALENLSTTTGAISWLWTELVRFFIVSNNVLLKLAFTETTTTSRLFRHSRRLSAAALAEAERNDRVISSFGHVVSSNVVRGEGHGGAINVAVP